MDVPLSNLDIERALKTTNGYRGVFSYDLLPKIHHGEFAIVNTDNVLPLFDEPESGHHWLTVCREHDNALVFDTFGRSLSQMEISYSEPKFQQYILNALTDCTVFTNTQKIQNRTTAVCGWYAILVGKLFSTYEKIDDVLEYLAKTFSHDTLANDRLVLSGGQWTDTLADELHRPQRKHFQRRQVKSNGINEIWSADLVIMNHFARHNRGYKYLLTIIDIFSRYAWVVPLKTKTGKEITAAFSSVLKKSKRKPQKLWTDRGSEFYNKTFKNFLKQQGIHMYSTHNEGKAVVIERFNRSLKGAMFKYFSANSTRNYVKILPSLVHRYNHRRHRTIKMTPHEASQKKNEERVKGNIEKPKKAKPPKFKLGDLVRVSKLKNIFAKGYTPNWTEEVFEIDQILPTNPITYKLIDLMQEDIEGSWYKQQLQKTDQNTFRVEKVLRKKKDQAFVKWSGYPTKFNSWIPLTDLEKL